MRMYSMTIYDKNEMSLGEFIFDHIYYMAFTFIPYIFLILRRPLWTTVKGAIIIAATCTVSVLILEILVSYKKARNRSNVVLNFIVAYGFSSMVLYVDLFPWLIYFVVAVIVVMIVVLRMDLSRVLVEDKSFARMAKKNFLPLLKRGLAIVFIFLMVLLICHRIEIFVKELPDIIHPFESEYIDRSIKFL